MSEERDRSVETGMVRQGPPPWIEWHLRPDGTARAVIRMDIGRGQNLLIDGCSFTSRATGIGTLAVSNGPEFYPRRWWERLLRRAPRPIEAFLTVTRNYFGVRDDD